MRTPFPETPMQFYTAVVLQPIERLREIPGVGWAISVAVALMNLVTTDVFGGALTLIILSGLVDYVLGRRVAILRDEYNTLIAQMGAHSKAAGVAIVLLVRMFEGWLGMHLGADSHGIVASAVAMGLFTAELESIAHHRETLGARPIPVLSALLNKIKERGEAMINAAVGVERGG